VTVSIFGTRHGSAPAPLSILDFVMTGKRITAREALSAGIERTRLADPMTLSISNVPPQLRSAHEWDHWRY
jgi:hypothetical protein